MALLIELLINKRLANKFPVVCLLGGVLLHIPAMLGGFLGCSATPDPKECLLLSVTSETWLSAVPPCKHFFPSRAPARCWKLPVCWVSPSLPSPLWDLSSISYLPEFHCSFQFSLLFWTRVVFCSQSTVHQESQQGVLSAQLLLFQIICAVTTGSGNPSSEVLPHIPYTPTEK